LSEQRGGYYETSGALRDWFRTTWFNRFLTAMELRFRFFLMGGDAVRDEQAKVSMRCNLICRRSLDRRSSRTIGPGFERRRSGAGTARRKTSLRFQHGDIRCNQAATGLTGMGRRSVLSENRKNVWISRFEIAIQFLNESRSNYRDTPIDRLRTQTLDNSRTTDEGISLRLCARLPGTVLMRKGVSEMDFNTLIILEGPVYRVSKPCSTIV